MPPPPPLNGALVCIVIAGSTYQKNCNNWLFPDFLFFIILQVIRRLREREEPIRLFGETDRDACLRLR